MRFFTKLIGFLGFSSHNEAHDTNNDAYDRINPDPIPTGPRKGFSVPVQLPVSSGPVLVPCHGNAGVQGLRWYAARLRTDEDGDVADEFLYEVCSDMLSIPSQDQSKPFPRFQVKCDARHAKIKHQILGPDGKLQHCVDFQGQLQWV